RRARAAAGGGLKPGAPAIDKGPGRLAEDEDGVPPLDRVDEEDEAAGDREVPEGGRDHARLPPLGGDPLDEEAAEEEGLAAESDGEPYEVVVQSAISSEMPRSTPRR